MRVEKPRFRTVPVPDPVLEWPNVLQYPAQVI